MKSDAISILSDREQLLQLLRQGKSQAQIAKELGVTARTVRLWERKHGLNRPFVVAKDPQKPTLKNPQIK